LDADLRKQLDGLPRRVNDQFSNLGDMVNFVIVGSQQNAQSRSRLLTGMRLTPTTQELRSMR